MFNVNLGTIGGPGPYPPPCLRPCVCVYLDVEPSEWKAAEGADLARPI